MSHPLDANSIDNLVDPATEMDHGPTTADVPPPPPQPKLKNIEDLRRLNTRATQEGMYTGVLGGGVMTWLAKRFGMSKNGLVATFIVGASGISFLTSRRIITQALGEHAAERRAAALEKAPDGAPLLVDPAAPVKERVSDDPRARLARELEDVGKPKGRTRYTKGKGLEGEVEEEAELRDTYFRPGVPRV